MKKKLLAGVLALLVLLGCVTVGWAGSQSDPLVSLSYLTGTFLDGLKAYVAQWVAQGTQESEDGWITSSGFVPGEGDYSDTVTLVEGSGLIWTAGSGAVSSGVLVDATAGRELSAGKVLTAGHRYLAGSDATVVASSQARWMTEGKWRLGTGGTVVFPLPFTDVPESAWYYASVRYAWENDLVSGVSETLFSPDASMERCMATTVLYVLAGAPEVSYSPVFSDVPDGQWYTNGIMWCYQMDIVSGMGDGQFAPKQDITRQQMAVILYNYAVKTGWTADEKGDLSIFHDGGTVAAWAKDCMSWAVGAGIFGGDDKGMLLPGNGASRAQMAAILHSYMNWLDTQR